MLADRLRQAATPKGVSGQQAYTTAGSYTFTVPAGVTSVSMVCIGGGCGAFEVNPPGRSGGCLSYTNNVTVAPGDSLSVVVGAGASGYYVDGGTSSVVLPNLSVVCRAVGGGSATTADNVGDVKNIGGKSSQATGYIGGQAGGGAAGYSANGGNGSDISSGSSAASGGAASGGVYADYYSNMNYPYQYYGPNGGGGGGGVGILGTGTSGAAVTGARSGGKGGSGGADGGAGGVNDECTSGSSGTGGLYGGGGGSSGQAIGEYDDGSGWAFYCNGGVTYGAGAGGAVRIIWGAGRSYPSNAANV